LQKTRHFLEDTRHRERVQKTASLSPECLATLPDKWRVTHVYSEGLAENERKSPAGYPEVTWIKALVIKNARMPAIGSCGVSAAFLPPLTWQKSGVYSARKFVAGGSPFSVHAVDTPSTSSMIFWKPQRSCSLMSLGCGNGLVAA
jgi:hypothetical protein